MQPLKKQFICLITALRFLTIFPITWRQEQDGENFIGSVYYFPVIGLLIGVLSYLLCTILHPVLPPLVLCVLVVLILAVISGFLHLDGLADTADGFFSSRPKDRILEIMHDSRTGAMGVIALFFILLLKIAAIASTPSEHIATVIFFLPLSGRLAIVLTMSYLPYARPEGGLGKMFYAYKGKFLLPFTSISVFMLAGIIINISLAIISFLTVLIVVLLFGWWCKKTIGGTTGDTLGAVCEITESIVAVVLVCQLFY